MLYYMVQRYEKYLIYANNLSYYFTDNQGFNIIYATAKKLTLLQDSPILRQGFSTLFYRQEHHL